MEGLEKPWIPAARLLRPQGRRGELLADPEMDLGIFRAGLRLRLGTQTLLSPTAAERKLQESWEPTGRNAGRVVLKLEGVDSISEAEELEGTMLWLQTSDLPPLAPDTFRVRDLVGCSLYDHDRLVGEVVDVQFPVAADGRTRLHDAPDLLAVHLDGEAQDAQTADPLLVPFVRAWVVEMDLPAKRMLMNLPEGLLEGSPES